MPLQAKSPRNRSRNADRSRLQELPELASANMRAEPLKRAASPVTEAAPRMQIRWHRGC